MLYNCLYVFKYDEEIFLLLLYVDDIIIAGSNLEAAYMAAFNAIQECVWVKGVMSEISFSYDTPILLFMDSQSAINLVNNPMYHKKSKRIYIKYHWIREKVGDGDEIIRLLHVSSGVMVTDILTKALATDAFNKHTTSITGNGDYDTSDLWMVE